MLYEMDMPIESEAEQYFHATFSMSGEVGSNNLIMIRNAVNNMRSNMAIRLVQKVWEVFTKSSSIGLGPVVIAHKL